MLLLSDDLITQIIIHSNKDEPVIHFLILRNQIYGTFRHICDSDEVLLHVLLRELRQACKNRYVRSFFEWLSHEAKHQDALCFKGMERLMRQQNPDKGLKLVGDAAAEDFGAKYFFAMLKYCCNPADLEAMALLQEISSGPLPPDKQWKNHNLRRLHYLVNRDLEKIVWWYWLGDGDVDIPLLPIHNPHVCIWAAGCRHYRPETSEIIHHCSAKCRIRHEFDLWTCNFSVTVKYAVSKMNIGM
jgi:hypothetical protein